MGLYDASIEWFKLSSLIFFGLIVLVALNFWVLRKFYSTRVARYTLGVSIQLLVALVMCVVLADWVNGFFVVSSLIMHHFPTLLAKISFLIFLVLFCYSFIWIPNLFIKAVSFILHRAVPA